MPAVDAVGNASRLFILLGISYQMPCRVLKRPNRVTADMAPAVERAIAGQVAPGELRPDLDSRRMVITAPSRPIAV